MQCGNDPAASSPAGMQPVGGGIDQETRGDAQTTEREIQVGLILVAVPVAAEMMMILAVVVLVLLSFLLLEEVDMDLVVVRVDGSQIPR